MKKISGLIFLILIYGWGVFLRIDMCSKDSSPLFSSESALQYRYARMIARGESIPSCDFKAQYPEGLKVYRNLSVFMEFVVGYSFRLFKNVFRESEFHKFVKLYTPFFACLSIFAIYLITVEVFKDRTSGIFAALFYASVLPAVIRSSGWEFLRENFSFPFIFFHIYFFLKSINGPWQKHIKSALLSGLFLAISLISWHLAQFYFAVFVSFLLLLLVFGYFKDCFKIFPFVVMPAFIAGVFVPHLRASQFILSPPMLFSYVLILSLWLFRKRKLLIFLILLMIILFAYIVRPGGIRSYNHVYLTFIYKTLFLGGKPLDASLLPYEVRALWVWPFLSPSGHYLLSHFLALSIPLLFYLADAIVRIKRKASNSAEGKALVLGEWYLLFCFFCFGIFFLLFLRIVTFFIFFFLIFVAGAIPLVKRKFPRFKTFSLIIISILLVWEIISTRSYGKHSPFSFPGHAKSRRLQIVTLTNSQEGLYRWIEENTNEEDVILTHFHLSPPILAYTGRTIVLHSKFENEEIRKKVKDFYYSIFDSEEKIYRYCQKYGVDYLIYAADILLDDSTHGCRYLAESQTLEREWASYKMHFKPEELKHFTLVYENGLYRVYRVGESGKGILAGEHPLIYDESLFKRMETTTGKFTESINYVNRHYLYAQTCLKLGEKEKAIDQ